LWVNEAKTLWADNNRDIWQLPLFSQDGLYCGNVVCQVVEPGQCLVRYLVVFSKKRSCQYLVPCECIQTIGRAVRCTIRSDFLEKLPPYSTDISSRLELEIYRTLGQKPYWAQEKNKH